ncbi:MAG: DUF1707 domain-containing protein [Chloroflexota bacterium]|nr:DUF1707 domain-containing protein [Chloroflexota bacterium]
MVAGRLEVSELEERVGAALVARTYAELATLERDVPDRPRRSRRHAGLGERRTLNVQVVAVGPHGPLVVAVLVEHVRAGAVELTPAAASEGAGSRPARRRGGPRAHRDHRAAGSRCRPRR